LLKISIGKLPYWAVNVPIEKAEEIIPQLVYNAIVAIASQLLLLR